MHRQVIMLILQFLKDIKRIQMTKTMFMNMQAMNGHLGI